MKDNFPDMLNEEESKFILDFNNKRKSLPNIKDNKYIIVFNIKPYWCIQNNLLISNLLFHPLNFYYKTPEEKIEKFKHKNLIENIIKYELDDNNKSHLISEELDKLILFFRQL